VAFKARSVPSCIPARVATQGGTSTPSYSIRVYGIVDFVLRGSSMIDKEKVQKGRLWGYVAGIAIFVAVVAWRLVTR